MAASLTPEQQASWAYQLEHIHEDRRPATVAVMLILLVVSTIAVALRFLSRRISKAPYKLDDWLVAFSLVMVFSVTIAAYLDTHYGYGIHLAAVDLENIPKIQIVSNTFQLLGFIALTGIKLSLLSLYLRIFGSSRYRTVFYLVGLYVICYCITAIALNYTMCQPTSYIWDKNQVGSCMNLLKVYMSLSILNLIGDVLVVASPLPIVWKLQASRTKKLLISGIFMLGGLVCIVTFIRLFYLKRLFEFDFTWTGFEASILALLEVNIGLVCACLPVMRPLFRRGAFRSAKTSQPAGSYTRSHQSSKFLWPRSAKRNQSSHPTGSESFDRLPSSRDESNGPWDQWAERAAATEDRSRVGNAPQAAVPLAEMAPAQR